MLHFLFGLDKETIGVRFSEDNREERRRITGVVWGHPHVGYGMCKAYLEEDGDVCVLWRGLLGVIARSYPIGHSGDGGGRLFLKGNRYSSYQSPWEEVVLSRKERRWGNPISVEAVSEAWVPVRRKSGCTFYSNKIFGTTSMSMAGWQCLCVDVREGPDPRTRGKEARRAQSGSIQGHRKDATLPRQMVTSAGSLPESEPRSARWRGVEKATGPAPSTPQAPPRGPVKNSSWLH